MSFLRILSSANPSTFRRRDSSHNRSSSSDDLHVQIHLPGYGCCFMSSPDDPFWPHALSGGPRDDQLFEGQLDITVPCHIGVVRCKAVRMVFRTVSRLNMGGGRGWEEDVIFERKTELIAGNSEGIDLMEGTQRFLFTIILPSTLASHDWHPYGKISHTLHAEVEGLPRSASALSNISDLFYSPSNRRSSTTNSGRASPRSPHSRAPSPSPHSPNSPSLHQASDLSTISQEAFLPHAPTYADSQAQGKRWLRGTVEVSRPVMIMHNPSRTNTHNDLDIKQRDFAPGLGMYELKLSSDVFTIGGPLHIRAQFPDPSPETTIFHWKLILAQTTNIRSPRDIPETPPITRTRQFVLHQGGTRPEPGIPPDWSVLALWRGCKAGGINEGSYQLEENAFMPKDDEGRPSTLAGVETPIAVKHQMMFEVFFSVQNEDSESKPLPQPGPGGLRVLRVLIPIIVPICDLIPSILDLPMYEDEPQYMCNHGPRDQKTQNKLGIGGSKRSQSRNEYIEAHVLSQPCEDCAARSTTAAMCRPVWDVCACGLDVRDIEERMKAFALQGDVREGGETLIGTKAAVEEQGRGRSR